MHRFVQLLIARRLLREVEHERQRMGLNEMIREGDQSLARGQAYQPDWRHRSRSLAFGDGAPAGPDPGSI